MHEFICDECGSPASSSFSRSRFCSDACRYRWKCRNRDARQSVGYGVCLCGRPFGGKYGETWCRIHRETKDAPLFGPSLTDWPEFGPTWAPGVSRCETCRSWFAGYGVACSRPCSDRYYKMVKVNASTAISYGDCRRCGRLYVRAAHHDASGCCTAECTKRLRRSIRRRMVRAQRKHIQHEPYTLREIAERDGWRCHLCGGRVPDRDYTAHDKDPTIDHLIPQSHGGDDVKSNVALAHNRCNWERGNKGLAQLRLVGWFDERST